MSLLKTPWFTLVEIPVQSFSKMWVNFPDQPDLNTLVDQNINILGVELFTLDVLNIAPSGRPLAPLDEMKKATLLLVNDDKQRVYQYPVLGLNRVFSNAGDDFNPHVFDLQLFSDLSKIAWTKSGIQYLEAPDTEEEYSFLFGIHYEKLDAEKVKVV